MPVDRTTHRDPLNQTSQDVFQPGFRSIPASRGVTL
jgi:hypothetical protein